MNKETVTFLPMLLCTDVIYQWNPKGITWQQCMSSMSDNVLMVEAHQKDSQEDPTHHLVEELSSKLGMLLPQHSVTTNNTEHKERSVSTMSTKKYKKSTDASMILPRCNKVSGRESLTLTAMRLRLINSMTEISLLSELKSMILREEELPLKEALQL